MDQRSWNWPLWCRGRRAKWTVPMALSVLLILAAATNVIAASSAERIIVSRASPAAGIRGWVIGRDTRIRFESQMIDGLLTSKISARDGRTLWLYMESLGKRGEDALFMVVGQVRFT